MKTRNILLIIFCFGLTIPTQGQLLKKLKKRAEKAVERTILNKTDEKVSQKTGKTIDDVTSKKDKSNNDAKEQTKAVKTALEKDKVTANDLPNSYEFDWQYNAELIMESRKKDPIEMIFLIKEGATYQGIKMVDTKSKDIGNVTMLFDTELNTVVMFMEAQGNNFLQMHPIPEPQNTNDKVDFKITELDSKTILGYHCKGLQLEDNKYIIKVYHNPDGPIKLSNFMNFSGAKNIDLPDLDVQMVKQFSEGLIMEMQIIDKKKAKNNMTIRAKNLLKQSITIYPKDYKSMTAFSDARMN